MLNSLQPLPHPDLFVREDVSKPENRVNLALFSLMLVPRFRSWFLRQLELDEASTIYPPQNVLGGRPDFVVVGPDGVVAAWIEVELGGENTRQIAAYKATLLEPVKSIVGLASAGGDLCLEAIATRVNELAEQFDRQQAMNAGVLTELIAMLAHPPQGSNYREPSGGVRDEPLIRALAERLPDIVTFGIPPMLPGKAQVSSMSEWGWTMRVFSTVATAGSVQLMNKPSASKVVRVPSLIHLNKYLPHSSGAVAEYASFLSQVGVDITKLGAREQMPVDEEELITQAALLASCIRSLAQAYGGIG